MLVLVWAHSVNTLGRALFCRHVLSPFSQLFIQPFISANMDFEASMNFAPFQSKIHINFFKEKIPINFGRLAYHIQNKSKPVKWKLRKSNRTFDCPNPIPKSVYGYKFMTRTWARTTKSVKSLQRKKKGKVNNIKQHSKNNTSISWAQIPHHKCQLNRTPHYTWCEHVKTGKRVVSCLDCNYKNK